MLVAHAPHPDRASDVLVGGEQCLTQVDPLLRSGESVGEDTLRRLDDPLRLPADELDATIVS